MSEKKQSSNIKKSIILSGLVGTGGLFVAKLLGLFYSIPLSSILASDALMNYYGTAYRIYSYILNVFTAGFPFAIATLVAKYTVENNPKMLLILKKMSLTAMAVTGAAGMLLLMLFSGLLAGIVAPPQDYVIMRNVLVILSLAIFFVPLLSAYRGFYQGRKEMTEYAFSQTFEQLFRVGFLLSVCWLVVYVLNMERKYALYIAVLSTSVAAVAGIAQIWLFDRKKSKEIIEEAEQQGEFSYDRKELWKEFLGLAIPYLFVAIVGYCDDIFNSILLPLGLRMHQYSPEDMSVILSAFNYVGAKLVSIPNILAPGFSAALIPHISAARAEKDMEKVSSNVLDCLNIVLYIGIPVSFCIALYAGDIYHVLFYTDNAALSAACVRWIAVEGFLATISPVVTNIMMALGLKKKVLRHLTENFIIKGVLMVPLIVWLGFKGAVIASMCGNLYLFFINLYEINKEYQISFRNTAVQTAKIVLALAAMFGVCALLRLIGIDAMTGRRIVALVKLMVSGIAVVITYAVVTGAMKVPQSIFHTDLSGVFRRLTRRG